MVYLSKKGVLLRAISEVDLYGPILTIDKQRALSREFCGGLPDDVIETSRRELLREGEYPQLFIVQKRNGKEPPFLLLGSWGTRVEAQPFFLDVEYSEISPKKQTAVDRCDKFVFVPISSFDKQKIFSEVKNFLSKHGAQSTLDPFVMRYPYPINKSEGRMRFLDWLSYRVRRDLCNSHHGFLHTNGDELRYSLHLFVPLNIFPVYER